MVVVVFEGKSDNFVLWFAEKRQKGGRVKKNQTVH
jgi:hypothetical protein